MTPTQTLYPTHTFIRNLVLTGLVGKFSEGLEYPQTRQVIFAEYDAPAEGTKEGNDLIKDIVSKFSVDLGDYIYDTISVFDRKYENDPEWFSEEGADIKDNLRDEVLELIGFHS